MPATIIPQILCCSSGVSSEGLPFLLICRLVFSLVLQQGQLQQEQPRHTEKLLTEPLRLSFRAPPTDERRMVRHHTLSADNLGLSEFYAFGPAVGQPGVVGFRSDQVRTTHPWPTSVIFSLRRRQPIARDLRSASKFAD